MSEELPDIGKISPEIFQELIYPRLGAKNDKILVGPQNGVDVRIVEIGNKVAAVTCDPVFIVPEYGWERSAWFAINILASDAACSGLKPAIEATGIFATALPQVLEKEFGSAFLKKAQDIFWEMSVVKDALTAVKVGVRENGVTAMHDATECGIWGGLYEIAQASRVGMRIEKEKIVVVEEAIKICKYFGIDPYASICEGTLLITYRPHKSKDVINLLKKEGIDSSIVGEVVDKKEGIKVMEYGKEKNLVHPRIDPFWGAFYKALGEKGNP